MQDYFKTLLSVAESFLRNTEVATHDFGTQVYMLLFEEFVGDFFRREVCSLSFNLLLVTLSDVDMPT